MKNPNIELLSLIYSEKQPKVKCKCKLCGNEFLMWRSHYYRGSTGCKCHIHHKRLFRIYTNMKSRCFNSNVPSYARYGGRGITVCDEWKDDFKAFYDWSMNNGYSDDLTVDRINCNGNYEPSNCRWVTAKEQNQNKRNVITINGQSLKQWCESNGLNYKTVHSYIQYHEYKDIDKLLSRYINHEIKMLKGDIENGTEKENA